MLRNPTPEEIRQLVEDRVTRAGKTDKERAEALDTSRPTLDRWRASDDLRLRTIAKLAEASGEAIILRFDPDPTDTTKQAAPPEWAERLAETTAAKVIEALAPDDLRRALETLTEKITGLPEPTVSSDPVVSDSGAQDGATPGDPATGSHHGSDE